MNIKEITEIAKEIHEKEQLINAYDAFVKAKKKQIRTILEKNDMTECIAGDLAVILKTVPETLIADADAMKADGVFEKYSKPKKGYVSVTVKEIKSQEK